MTRLLAVLVCALGLVPVAAAAQDGTGLTTEFPTEEPPFLEEGESDAIPGADLIPPPEDYSEPRLVDAPKAWLRGLDTLNNTVDDFEIAVGQTLIFKRLEIRLEACRYPEGNLAAEAYGFLRIRDRRIADPMFEGWMLASSPALSALDHPRYDVWVLSCKID